MKTIYAVILTLVIFTATVASLIGYDCGHESVQVSSLSTLDVGPCNLVFDNITSEEEEIQLLQTSTVSTIHVYQCKISIIRSIFHCGMHSHASTADGGVTQYVYDLRREDCMNAHRFGTLKLQDTLIDSITANHTTTANIMAAGKIDKDHNCEKGTYSSGGVTHTGVTVQMNVQITLTDYETVVRLEGNDVVIRGGYTCPYSGHKCMDVEGGNTYWEYDSKITCEESKYDVLYTGIAQKTITWEKGQKSPIIMYTVKTGEPIFTVITTYETPLCYVRGYATEHPSLFVAPMKNSARQFTPKTIPVKNLDMFTYMNNKFVHVEKHMKGQMESLYKDIITQKCNLEREMLATQLAIAGINPSEFATLLMKGPGHTATLAGEVIHITKCQAVDVVLRVADKCYQELPVLYNNASFFLTPKSHLLQTHGTEIQCSSILPSLFLIHNEWYRIAQGASLAKIPNVLSPGTTDSWTYQNPGVLAKTGIYQDIDLKKLRDIIMYPNERQALTNTVVRAASGMSYETGQVSLNGMIDQNSVSTIFKMHIATIWGFASKVGMICNGMMGFFVCYKILKYIFDTGFHCQSLYEAFGLSWRLVMALWDTLTYRTLTRARGQHNTPSASSEETELQVVMSQPSCPQDLDTTDIRKDEERHLVHPYSHVQSMFRTIGD